MQSVKTNSIKVINDETQGEYIRHEEKIMLHEISEKSNLTVSVNHWKEDSNI